LLIIEGKADTPVYLWIHDEVAEIRGAHEFWGMDTYEAIEALKEDIGERRASVLTIGPAGEKLVAIASVVADSHSFAGRCGIGAVMGEKNLKAVVVHGTKHPPVANPDKLETLRKELRQKTLRLGKGMRDYGTPDIEDYHSRGNISIKYWTGDSFEEGAKSLGQPVYNEVLQVKPLPCLHCTVGCHRHIKVTEPEKYACEGVGPEYEAIGMLGMSNLVSDLKAVAKANDYCNRLGIDAVSAGATIGFAIECYERGLITKEDTNGMELRWGDGDLLIELVKQIGLREGFGTLFAEGNLEAARKIGKGAEGIVMQVRGLDFPCHDPRLSWSMAPNYATCTRGACHCKGLPGDVEFGLYTVPELGFPEQTEFFDAQGKTYLAVKCQDFSTLLNSLSLCMFMVNCGMTLTDILNSFNAITGLNWSIEQLIEVGERSFNLQRLINIRDGKGGKYDTMPKRVFEPATSGFRKGKVPPFDALMNEYYELRGWDKRTGIPKKKKLIELGISD
jgi:aldehyde:ferredoxin oxidoreductase